MRRKFVIKKFDGDDAYSYAIFEKKDVAHIKGNQVFWSDGALAVMCGMTRSEANYHKSVLEVKEIKNERIYK